MHILKPSDIKPFPKAPPRKTNRKSRLEKSRIYTNIPEKTRVEELEEIRKLKLKKTGTKKKLVINSTSAQKLKDSNPTKKQILHEKKNKEKIRKTKKRAKESDTSSDSESEYFKAMKKKNRYLGSSSDSDIGMESDCDEFAKLLGDKTDKYCSFFFLLIYPP
ncbi:unnamed protein product [Ceutorhynchus assimilis]|uniref:Uncharacterized protein n=1 Tax=Ceutorhynchus assimilis TaxID=467358 RepID=A0A9N9MKF2_9CUCU|nr:unnamed protein product [Ceutorhynchus assimilis]